MLGDKPWTLQGHVGWQQPRRPRKHWPVRTKRDRACGLNAPGKVCAPWTRGGVRLEQPYPDVLVERQVELGALPETNPCCRVQTREFQVAYFNELSLDRIDSLNHKVGNLGTGTLRVARGFFGRTSEEARNLLTWNPGPVDGPDTPLDFLQLGGQAQTKSSIPHAIAFFR